jgi:hypothetical protein
MKWVVMNFVIMYVIFCADDVNEHDDWHTIGHRVLRAIVWPVTVTQWFRRQNIRVHRLLTILWILLVAGWFFSLMADRL